MNIHRRPFTRRAMLAEGLIALISVAASARADVIVVDPQGGYGIDMLQAAIDSSHDGDVILLEPGDYRPWDGAATGMIYIYARGITLVADSDGTPIKFGRVNLDAIPPTGTTVLRGFDIERSDNPYDFGCAVSTSAWTTHSAGALWIEECALAGSDAALIYGSWWTAAQALEVDEGQAILVRSTVTGGAGHIAPPLPASPGAPAVIAFNSSLIVADSVVRGGKGGASWHDPTGAGPGIDFTQGWPWNPNSANVVWISGSQVLGGDEGADDDPWAYAAPAVLAEDPGNTLAIRDSTVAAGHQLPGHWKWVPDIEGIAPDAVIAMPAAARSCHVPAPARANTELALSVHGLPGDAVMLIVSDQGDAWFRPQLQGSLGIKPLGSFVVPPLTITDPSGDADIIFRLPEVPAVFGGGTTLFIQGAFAGSDGVTLGAPTALIWLGSGY